MSNITKRQLEVLKAIRSQMESSGYPPTIRELGDILGIRSTNGVNDHLKTLTQKGLIERTNSKSRALTITALGFSLTDEFFSEPLREEASSDAFLHRYEEETVSLARVPLLGRIAAGIPIDAIEHIEDHVTIDASLLGRSSADQCFALRVEGESMIEDGILDGDIVFIRKQSTANRGETVAVMVDGSATLKRYYRDGNQIRLQPANASMEPIFVPVSEATDFSILGRVVGLQRSF